MIKKLKEKCKHETTISVKYPDKDAVNICTVCCKEIKDRSNHGNISVIFKN